MKTLLRVILVVVLLVIIGVGVLYFYRNSLVRAAVERQANASLGVKTTVGGANLGLFGGTLSLSELRVGSPSGYSADRMLALNELGLGVRYGDLTNNPIRIKQITIDRPKAVLEFANGKFNFQSMMDQMAGKNPKDDSGKDPKKLIVEQLALKDAEVVVQAPMLPKAITVKIPSVTLKDIGTGEGSKNGAAIKDVAAAVLSALAASAAGSADLKNFGNIDKLLADQAQQVMGQVSTELQKQVSGITANITGELNKAGAEIGKIVPGGGDLTKAIPGATGGKDPAKGVEEGLKNLIPGGKKDEKKK